MDTLSVWLRALVPPVLYHIISRAASAIWQTAGGSSVDLAAGGAAVCAAAAIPVMWLLLRRDGAAGATGRGPSADNDGEKRERKLWLYILAPFIGALLAAVYGRILALAGLERFFSNETQEELLASAPVFQLLGPGLLAPIAEEMTFRGLCFPRLKAVMPVWGAALVSSLCFAAGHGNVIQFVYALPMGMAFCVLLQLPGSGLGVPILAHMGANLLTLVQVLGR